VGTNGVFVDGATGCEAGAAGIELQDPVKKIAMKKIVKIFLCILSS